MTATGDFNGDGIVELAIGQPGDASNILSYGYVHLLQSTPEATRAQAAAELTLIGSRAGEQIGWALASGDLDADGLADLWIGAPGALDGGLAYLVYGQDGASGTWGLNAETAHVASAGADMVGWALAAGDINLDGIDDAAIGAPLRGLDHPNEGSVSLVWGRRGERRVGLQRGDGQIVGGTDDALLGVSLGIADLMGGGVQDLVIGAPGLLGTATPGAGGVAVFRGRRSWPGTLTLNEADLRFIGEGPAGTGSAAGTALAAGCDLDGDGRGDMLVGAPDFSDGGAPRGRVYLLTATARLSGQVSLSAADGIWTGNTPGDRVGGYLACVGDLDGDGYQDAVAGASEASSGAGELYVLFGRPGSWPSNGSMSDWSATLRGGAASDGTGAQAAAPWDTDGDGTLDLIVSSPGADPTVDGISEPNAGSLTVVTTGR